MLVLGTVNGHCYSFASMAQSEGALQRFTKTKPDCTQRAQYTLIKEYGVSYIGLHIMV